ncbi:MAG: outer membrane lipid asymmetry maintenance protein MlaD [Gammaproteobacteria bacterium]|nr:outer membrane lipid asymmetry maintenance protein MlaD [Gammaproteobacteria bacterium]
MQSRVLEILVGFFVVLGVAAIFVLTYRVASLNTMGTSGTYTVTAKFDDIGSLAPGASVKLAGVRIGQVTGIRIDAQSFEAVVSMAIDNQYDNIPTDSSAKILTQGLLGSQYVGLEPGGAEDSLKNGSRILLTQSAFVLENVLGQFLVNASQSGSSSKSKPAGASSAATTPSH